MSAITITRKNYEKQVERCKTPVLLSFVGEDGVSSLLLKATADALSVRLGGKIKVGVVEVNPTNAELSGMLNLRFFPSSVILKNGVVTDRIIGNPGTAGFISILAEHNSQ